MGMPVDSSRNRPSIPGAEISLVLQLLAVSRINGASEAIASCLVNGFMSASDEGLMQLYYPTCPTLERYGVTVPSGGRSRRRAPRTAAGAFTRRTTGGPSSASDRRWPRCRALQRAAARSGAAAPASPRDPGLPCAPVCLPYADPAWLELAGRGQCQARSPIVQLDSATGGSVRQALWSYTPSRSCRPSRRPRAARRWPTSAGRQASRRPPVAGSSARSAGMSPVGRPTRRCGAASMSWRRPGRRSGRTARTSCSGGTG